jgi:hypothetical protein
MKKLASISKYAEASPYNDTSQWFWDLGTRAALNTFYSPENINAHWENRYNLYDRKTQQAEADKYNKSIMAHLDARKGRGYDELSPVLQKINYTIVEPDTDSTKPDPKTPPIIKLPRDPNDSNSAQVVVPIPYYQLVRGFHDNHPKRLREGQYPTIPQEVRDEFARRTRIDQNGVTHPMYELPSDEWLARAYDNSSMYTQTYAPIAPKPISKSPKPLPPPSKSSKLSPLK